MYSPILEAWHDLCIVAVVLLLLTFQALYPKQDARAYPNCQ